MNKKHLYYLIAGRYGNSHIASADENMFKIKVFNIITEKGPIWAKKREVLNNLLSLEEEEVLTGQKTVSNHASNPGELGYADSQGQILDYINDQNTLTQQRGKVLGLADYLSTLEDPTEEFLGFFKKLFLTIVNPELPLWYETEVEDNNTVVDCCNPSLYGNFRTRTFCDVFSSPEEFIEELDEYITIIGITL